MSGHSKWANIKRRKESQDQKRGKVFSKLSRLITIAVKEGNSADPETNPRLRMAIEKARAENMPKENIHRALKGALKKKESIEEFLLEGYGPEGIAVLVEAVTDSRQRTIQEIKNIFRSNGGSLAEPGAVSFQFEKKAMVEVVNPKKEEKTLELIDLGAEEIEDEGGSLIIWLKPLTLGQFLDQVKKAGFLVRDSGLVMRAKTGLKVAEPAKAKNLINFLELIEDNDDVQEVFTNLEIPKEVLQKINH